MATRSNIAIILKEEDKERVFAELNERLEETGNNFRYGVDNGNVLQMILAGDCSYIEGGVACHYTSKGEYWASNRPEQRMHARRNEDYLYVFRDGTWKIGRYL